MRKFLIKYEWAIYLLVALLSILAAILFPVEVPR